MTVLAIIAIAVFAAYIATTLIKFKSIPASLSDTYYLWGDKGWLFTASMIGTAALILPAMIAVGEGSPWQFLGFLAPAALIFAGMAPKFKTDATEGKLHIISALVCGASAFLWCILTVHRWWVLLIVLAVNIFFCILASRKKEQNEWDFLKTTYTFWVEMWAFISTFLALLTAL